MTWREPESREEYDERMSAVLKGGDLITGFGAEVTTHTPCPWCATPNFQAWGILTAAEDLTAEATCVNCGRSGKSIVFRNLNGTSFEMVQTGGPDAPDWLVPAPRRMEGR